jgi:ketosteroid isomerase-like protein
LSACIAFLPLSSAQEHRSNDETGVVKQTLASFIKLQLRYDAESVAKMLDDAFLYVSPDGSKMNRTEFIRLTSRETNPLESLEVTDVEVHVSGNTAIATGLIHEKGLLYGKPYEFHGRTLITFIKKDGRWVQLACHD